MRNAGAVRFLGVILLIASATPAARADQSSPWPDVACPASAPTSAARAQRIRSLVAVIRAAMVQTSPHWGEVGGGVFSGNADWHSSVHAHWALLSIARVMADSALEAEVLARLTPAALERERQYLLAHPRFELPYGQSWLLLLLRELALRPPVAARPEFTRLLRDSRARVLDWLETSRFPEIGGPIGTHDSWLFAYLMTALSAPGDSAIQVKLATLARAKLDPARPAIANFEAQDWDFLFLPAVLATIDQIKPGAVPATYPVGASVPFQSSIIDTNAHTAGAAMVRLWPAAIQAGATNPEPAACARFQSRMNEFFARPDQWRDGFETVGHWVPQFAWMGLWLELGRP